jgi:hypothetical protein
MIENGFISFEFGVFELVNVHDSNVRNLKVFIIKIYIINSNIS